jgi:hypothetical protein
LFAILSLGVVFAMAARAEADCPTQDGAVATLGPSSVLPNIGSKAWHLAVLGDVGMGDSYERAVAGLVGDAGQGDAYDGLVLLGDNVYPDGQPDRLDSTVFEPFSTVLDQGTALLPVLGNHDVLDGHACGQVEALGMPGRWYAATVGPSLLIALDSNLVRSQAQTEWLEATLAEADARWIIVAMHHPAYSVGQHGPTADIQKRWVPIFEKHGVDLVLAGHDHDYQRTMPINGVTYIVSGGGSKTRPTGDADYIVKAEAVRHFVDIVVGADRLEVSAVSSDGPLDHLTIQDFNQSDTSRQADPAGVMGRNSGTVVPKSSCRGGPVDALVSRSESCFRCAYLVRDRARHALQIPSGSGGNPSRLARSSDQ